VRYTGKTHWLTIVFVKSFCVLPVAAPAQPFGDPPTFTFDELVQQLYRQGSAPTRARAETLASPNTAGQPYRFAPHFGEALIDLNLPFRTASLTTTQSWRTYVLKSRSYCGRTYPPGLSIAALRSIVSSAYPCTR
jgi:hypothetical protein